MNCSKCGRESSTVITFINQTTGQAEYFCDDCLINGSSAIHDIDTLDRLLNETESNLKKLTNLLEEINKSEDAETHDDLPAFFMTPAKLLEFLQSHYNSLLREREKELASMPDLDRLLYDLRKAIEIENYEKAAELRDRIAKLESKDV